MAQVPEPATLYRIRLRIHARHSASVARTRSCSGTCGFVGIAWECSSPPNLFTFFLHLLLLFFFFLQGSERVGSRGYAVRHPPFPSNTTWGLVGSTMLISVPSRPHILRSITTQLHWSNTEPRMAQVPEPATLYRIRLRIRARHSASVSRTHSCSGQEGLGPSLIIVKIPVFQGRSRIIPCMEPHQNVHF
jgi:hypothetical protein